MASKFFLRFILALFIFVGVYNHASADETVSERESELIQRQWRILASQTFTTTRYALGNRQGRTNAMKYLFNRSPPTIWRYTKDIPETETLTGGRRSGDKADTKDAPVPEDSTLDFVVGDPDDAKTSNMNSRFLLKEDDFGKRYWHYSPYIDSTVWVFRQDPGSDSQPVSCGEPVSLRLIKEDVTNAVGRQLSTSTLYRALRAMGFKWM